MTNKNKINLIKSTDTLKNAMKKLEKSKYKCLIIVDKNEKLIEHYYRWRYKKSTFKRR